MAARWLTRHDLGATGGSATGLLLVAPDLSSVFPLDPADRTACVRMTGEALAAVGVGAADRVVVALAEPAGSLWASAAADVGAAAASVGPRGRMRLHHALTTLRATTLVATPTGVMDFLARLHLEFLLDPLDLGLRHIVLTGEIASKRTIRHLAGEFGAAVSEAYSSPFSGGALAWRTSEEDSLTPVADGVLGLAALDKDEPYVDAGPAELVITAAGHSTLGDAVLRTGQVAGAASASGGLPAPEHTVGEHVLVRGVWVSLPRLEKALSKIDGVSGWELTISRAGTLDSAVLTVTFGRQSLVANPMWQSRIREALRALTPVAIGVDIAPEAAEAARPGLVNDLRGQHLGRDRALLT
jgi:phenylacetate-CoA ligase